MRGFELPHPTRLWVQAMAIACCSSLTIHLSAAEANAKPPFLKGFQEDLYTSADPQLRAHWFDESVKAKANIVRIGVSWRALAGPRAPDQPRDPTDPAYDFGWLDAAVMDAGERGLRILLTVAHAPDWAEGGDRPRRAKIGTWKPRPASFGAVGEALARRYSGGFATASGLLPRVEYFEAWNEPNQNEFLAPQWRRGKPFAPDHYRRMLNAFYSGVKKASPKAKVIGPGTSPFGDPSRRGSRMRPLLFVRELLCLRGRKKLDPGPCARPARLDIVSHHPINLVGGPRDSADHPDDLTVPDMRRLRTTVRAAERARTLLPRGHRPLWVSELWWLTDPPRSEGVRPRTQARYLQESFYRLWAQGVQAVLWYQITDSGSFESGLYFKDGTAKPSLTAFRFPFVVDPRRGTRIIAWGIPPASGTLSIERKRNGSWRTIRSLRVRAQSPFRTSFRSRGRSTLRATVAGDRSLPWRHRG